MPQRSPMKLIVGLGNPGRKYAGTRHNVGFDVLDLLSERHRLEWESGPADALVTRWRSEGALLAKPLTFMNLSGFAAGDLLRFYKIDPVDMLVVVDDVNLELGRLRARAFGSAGGHNGLKSLIEQLGDSFSRLRVGVGRGDTRRDLADHVLAKFDDGGAVSGRGGRGPRSRCVRALRAEGIGPVMNRFNRREDKEGDDGSEDKKDGT